MKNTEQLTDGLAQLDAIVRRINSGEVSQIDIDLLQQTLRTMYGASLLLTAETEASSSETTTDTQSMEGHTADTAENTPIVPVIDPSNIDSNGRFDDDADAMPKEEVIAEKSPLNTNASITISAEYGTPVDDEDDDTPVPAQPLMESLENNGNDTLFVSEAPQQEEAAEMPEQSQKYAKTDTAAEETAETAESETDKQPKQQSSLFDYLSNNASEQQQSQTLGERLGYKSTFRGDSVHQKRIEDLRTVININDKFSFMTDLFHNDMRAYNDFILTLNGIGDRQTALKRVEEIATRYSWDKNSLTVQSFFQVFDRKFGEQ